MLDESKYAPLINVVDKLDVFLVRRPVQIQLFTLSILALFAFAVSYAVWSRLLPRALNMADRIQRRHLRKLVRVLFRLAASISFPTLSLLLLEPARAVLEANGLPGGLLAKTSWVLATLFAFRVVRAILYTTLDEDIARRFHKRFLVPLFFVLLIIGTLDNLTDLPNVYAIEITKVLGTVLKVGPICLATIGLYFFAGALSLAEELVHKFVSTQTKMDPGKSKATLTLARYIVLIGGVLAAFSEFELDSTVVAAISGGLSIGVGFGLREILSNFISGFLLLFERSLNPGDVIEMDNQLSKVEALNVRATTVRTLNNEELVIPNQTFLTSSFKTYTGTCRNVRVPIMVQTDCNINLLEVLTLMRETADTHPEVLDDRESTVFVMEYANNVATFQLNVWIADPLESPRIQSEIRQILWEAFKEHDVALPFPEMDLHFPKTVPVNAELQPTGAAE